MAWKHLGNAITISHAIFAISTVMPLMTATTVWPNPKEVVMQLLRSRITKHNADIHENPQCWIVAKHAQIQEAIQRATDFYGVIHSEVGSIPSGSLYIISHGVITFELFLQQIDVNRVAIPQQISPTIKDWGWKQLVFMHGPLEIIGANIHADCKLVDVLPFWGDCADMEQLPLDRPDEIYPQKLVIGCRSRFTSANDQHAILAFVQGQAWIRSMKEGTMISEIQLEHQLSNHLSNILGMLKDNSVVNHSCILLDDLPDPIPILGDIIALCRAMYHAHIQVVMNPKKDQMHVVVLQNGCPEEDWHQLQIFWAHHARHAWWGKVGRELIVKHGTIESQFTLTVKTTGLMLPIPLPDALIILLTSMMRSVFATISLIDPNGQSIRIKWSNDKIWEGTLPRDIQILWFRTVFHFFYSPWTNQHPMSFIAFGKRVGDEMTLHEIATQSRSSKKDILLVVQEGFVGGGGERGAKRDWDMQIRNQIASALLPHGVNVATLPQLTEGILKHFGRSRLQQALKAVSPDRQEDEIIKLAHQAGYHVKVAHAETPKVSTNGKNFKQRTSKENCRALTLQGYRWNRVFLPHQMAMTPNKFPHWFRRNLESSLPRRDKFVIGLLMENPYHRIRWQHSC